MKRLLTCTVVLAALLTSHVAAQQAGTGTNHAYLLGKGAGKQGFTSLLCASAQLAVGQSAADPICQTITGDMTVTAAGVTAIGASKVTNSQLATMAANSTKCNATAGTANPTDCSGATMRTNLGLVIGTNVQAWDSDLDCVAALGTTGVIKRTGSGTCSAGTVAVTDLATGTQDTIVGYFGSTAASALSINNCTGALTYSTTTHTFGCNATAGTGTVTSVGLTNAYGLSVSGSPVTTSGNISAGVSLTTSTNSLGADVTLTPINTYVDGPSVAQGSTGVWCAFGTVTLQNSSSATNHYDVRLYDGSTVIASTQVLQLTAGAQVAAPLSGCIASPAGNIRISARNSDNNTAAFKFNISGNAKDSTLTVFRIQ